jgi:hypothetical protein
MDETKGLFAGKFLPRIGLWSCNRKDITVHRHNIVWAQGEVGGMGDVHVNKKKEKKIFSGTLGWVLFYW